MHDYTEFKEEVGGNRKAVLADMADRMQAKERRIQELNEELEKETAELRDISTIEIPAFFDQIEGKLKLDDGREIVVATKIRAGIKKDAETASEAYRWLDEKGHGALIKNVCVIEFPKEKGEEAAELFRELRKRGFNVKIDRMVHWQTLTSWVKTQLKKGVELPFELLGIYKGQETKIKSPQ